MTRKQRFGYFSARLKRAGLSVSRSDKSETIYVSVGDADLRISGHELGRADYGSRDQRHRGPEVITTLEDPVIALIDCLYAVRLYAKERGGYMGKVSREGLAKVLRIFRAL